jgi:hypothetical protein
MHDVAFKIQIEIDESKVQEQVTPRPMRPLTAAEKVERMKAQNPAIGDLIQKFDLRAE